MMVLEDLRLALRQICRAMGLPGNVATVVSLIVLGVGLNLVALRAVAYVGIGRHACHNQTALKGAARTELKVMRTVVVSTLKKIGDSGRRICFAQQRLIEEQRGGTEYHVRVGIVWLVPTGDPSCDATVANSKARKTAIAFVEC
jgi:hypothetical protein